MCSLCMLEAVEGGLCLMEVLDVMHRVLLGSPNGSEVPEAMRCLPLCPLEVPEAMHCVLLCSLEVLEVPEVMRCVLLCMLEAVRSRKSRAPSLSVPTITFRHHAVGVVRRRYGGMLRAWGGGGVDLLELGRHAVGLGTWSHVEM